MRIVLDGDRAVVFQGDCRDLGGDLPPRSVDAVVCDPPYELGFMGKGWDSTGVAFEAKTWATFLRVLKPGGHLVAFGGSRTYHRIACAIEDAGFELRDSLMWLYGTGFPKSLDVSKAMDKAAGPEGPPLARQWDGWGTALKPAFEPIILARKPLEGTVAANVAKWGTGAINVGACRIGAGKFGGSGVAFGGGWAGGSGLSKGYETKDQPEGRWPANVLLDEDAAAQLDAQAGERKSGAMRRGTYAGRKSAVYSSDAGRLLAEDIAASSGGASRFFYCAKTSRAERDAGCDALPTQSRAEATGRAEGSAGSLNPRAGAGSKEGGRNNHPTVKPLALMRWLVRLVTPPGGVVLDPFAGSGSTGVAVLEEGFDFVGCEMTDEYIPIIEARIRHALK